MSSHHSYQVFTSLLPMQPSLHITLTNATKSSHHSYQYNQVFTSLLPMQPSLHITLLRKKKTCKLSAYPTCKPILSDQNTPFLVHHLICKFAILTKDAYKAHAILHTITSHLQMLMLSGHQSSPSSSSVTTYVFPLHGHVYHLVPQ